MATIKAEVTASFSREIEIEVDVEQLAYEHIQNGEADEDLGFDTATADNWDVTVTGFSE